MNRLATRLLLLCALVSLLPATGCGGGGGGGDEDAGPDTGADGGRDGATSCRSHDDCSDGVFCNGEERCLPDDPAADALGCVASEGPACMPTQTCDEATDACLTECDVDGDADGDGRDAIDCGGDDCDDADPNRYPGNTEICDVDGRDEDCNPATFGFQDLDGDGFPSSLCCNAQADGSDLCGSDCDDMNRNLFPGNTEACDGFDNDCDGTVDEGVRTTYFVDDDGDGFGSATAGAPTMEACFPPDGYAANDDDCDDTAAAANPGNAEVCDAAGLDEDCDGEANPASLCSCTGDVTRSCALPGICSAGTERCIGGSWGFCSISPLGEVCNGTDDDCDGSTDESLTVTCYDDPDDDGYAASGATPTPLCPVSGRGAVGGCPFGTTNRAPMGSDLDCDDTRSDVSPGASERCDAARVDDDCDGMQNEGCACDDGATRTCPEAGVCGGGSQTCAAGAWGVCTVRPGIEICNGLDDDCDGSTDETLRVTCFEDDDDDSYAVSGAASSMECPVSGRSSVGGCPFGTTNRDPATATDCNDARDDVRPGAAERCDAAMVDEDCDGMQNEDCACSVGASRGCPDPGVCAGGTQSCSASGWGLCSIQPATDVCNGDDDDCDGFTDEGVDVQCWDDADDDGYAAMGASTSLECPVTGRAAVGGCPFGTTNRDPAVVVDCDDARGDVRPGAAEQCDAAMTDEDCDEERNEDCECAAGATRACLASGVCAGGTQTCTTAGTWAPCTVQPGIEICNGLDDDCDASTDETLRVLCYDDEDDDTYAATGAGSTPECPVTGRSAVGGCPFGTTNRAPSGAAVDCDDTREDVRPSAAEQCDGAMTDEDCDGMQNENCTCAFGDSRGCPDPGVCAGGTQSCTAGGSWGLCSIQAAADVCNDADDDCDGLVDEGVNVLCWVDADDDGFADAAATSSLECPVSGRGAVGGCPFGTTDLPPSTASDCDDGAPGVNPAAAERCDGARVDDDCDGTSNEGCTCGEGDSEVCPSPGICAGGTRTCLANGTWGACTVQPGIEVCNGTDDDCDGSTDESLRITCYDDGDDDTYAVMGATSSLECPVTGRAAVGGCPFGTTNRVPAGIAVDCDDTRDDVRPNAAEQCDGGMVDEDCDGTRNEDCTCSAGQTRGCLDPGECASGTQTCQAGGTWGACSVQPSAEGCDGQDDDCDGKTDEGVTVACYVDGDSDGFAAVDAASVDVCGCSSGYTRTVPVDTNIDCDDGTSTRSPVAPETCNALDDDCDGTQDEGLPLRTRYVDADGDGASGSPVSRCEGDPNSVAVTEDCNESDTTIFVGAPELCDRKDNNCSSGGGVDDSEDADGDGQADTMATCSGGPLPKTDCNDEGGMGGTIYLGAPEICDGLDNDCDTVTDEAASADPDCQSRTTSGTAVCVAGRCGLTSCPLLRADCDYDIANGCETDLTSAEDCGGCGIQCFGACTAGRCTTRASDLDSTADLSCATMDNGNVVCWGIGFGNAPAIAGSVSGAVEVTAHGSVRCVVDTSGAVVCQGNNDSGQLGDGTTTSHAAFASASTVSGTVLALSGGDRFTCALRDDGQVACFGLNGEGQLGDSITSHTSCLLGDCSPSAVLAGGLSNATAIDSGDAHTCVAAGGGARCWGRNASGQLGTGGVGGSIGTPATVTGLSGVDHVAVGAAHSCARLTDGSVQCWGDNGFGQLGISDTYPSSYTPVAIEVSTRSFDELRSHTRVTCGTFGLTGQAECWGDNTYGALTAFDNAPDILFSQVTDLVGAHEVEPGSTHNCALRWDGSVSCWGSANSFGQLGDATIDPHLVSRPVVGLNPPMELANGLGFTCGRRNAGDVDCWGGNGYGIFGDSPTRMDALGVGLDVGPSDFLQIAAGYDFVCGVRADRTLWCWGRNTWGQLGDGTTVDRESPAQVPGLTSVRQVDAEEGYACALRMDGTVACWGLQASGGSVGSPTDVPGVAGLVQIAVARQRSCGRHADGTVTCWEARTDPNVTDIAGLTGVVDLDVGAGHQCAVTALRLDTASGSSDGQDGRVYCWGNNTQGQLGDGTTINRGAPVSVAVPTPVRMVRAGSSHTCALTIPPLGAVGPTAGGTVYCWGYNGAGQLGRGTTVSQRAFPLDAADVATGVSLSAGPSNACALLASGRTVCWGQGTSGELGDFGSMNQATGTDAFWH